MLIEINEAFNALDEAISWRLRPALDADELFDELGSAIHRIFPELTITQIDLLLADLRRQHAQNMQQAEFSLFDAFRTTLGADV